MAKNEAKKKEGKPAKKEKAFGDFKSAAEINACAAGLKAEGDNASLEAMAEENGIEKDIVTLYISGDIPELCDDMTVAMGKLNTEDPGEKDTSNEGRLIHQLIKPYLESRTDEPEVCRAIMVRSMKEAAKKITAEAKKNGSSGMVYMTDTWVTGKVEDMYRI